MQLNDIHDVFPVITVTEEFYENLVEAVEADCQKLLEEDAVEETR
jgi:hypothetical protein